MAGTLCTGSAETAIHAQGPATIVTPCANSGRTLYNCGRDLGAKVAVARGVRGRVPSRGRRRRGE